MPFTLGEYQDIFLEEADEQLQELNQALLDLEQNPHNDETINSIFRTAHSLKSSAAFVGLNDLSDLAHRMENLLQGIRDKTMDVSGEIIDILFKSFDAINTMISTVASGEKPTQDLSPIIAMIQSISEKGKSGAGKTGSASGKLSKTSQIKIQYSIDERKRLKAALDEGRFCCEMTIYIDLAAQMRWLKAQLVLNNLEQIGDIVKTSPDETKLSSWEDETIRVLIIADSSADEIKKVCEIDQITRVDIQKITQIRKDKKIALKFHETETLFNEKSPIAAEERVIKRKAVIEERETEPEESDEGDFEKKRDDKKALSLKIVKVSVDKLDLLLNNVGELVIANSGFFKLFDELRKANLDKRIVGEFKNRMDQMSRIAKDLQSGIMKTRMVPIGQIFTRFNRLVRDLIKDTGKTVNLEIKGEDTELDKKVVDNIGEPLMHLIRNSIDHGIEPSEERIKLEKPVEAKVVLNAYQGGNQIFVEVSDDGRGLNIDKIRKVALDKGLTTTEMLANMSDSDIYEFIFLPGFSTAEVITDVSGRGVGMNVVKEAVTELNGNIRIETEPGIGTKFILMFPLTLAIVPAIMVKVSTEMYAIPLPDVIETIKIADSEITTIEGREVINLRSEILSLIRLNEFIGIESKLEDTKKIPVVVVGFGNRKIGIIVDSLEGKQEIVIKSLEENYTSIQGLSGASILGDGSICLILDIAAMINKVIQEEEKYPRHRRYEQKDEVAAAVVQPVKESAGSGFVSVVKDKDYKDIEKIIEPEPKIRSEAAYDKISFDRTEIKQKEQDKEYVIFDKQEIKKVKKEIIKEEKSDLNIRLNEKPKTEIESKTDEEIEMKVRSTLSDFRKELEERLGTVVSETGDFDHIMKILQIKPDDIEKISVISNIGIANAAESLSQILNKSVSLSIPEVEIISVQNISAKFKDIEGISISVHLPVLGDINGAILFIFSEESAFELIDMLFGQGDSKTGALTEDGESALKEVTNIVGSSILNVFSEKMNLVVRPDVPGIHCDYINKTIDSILSEKNMGNEYAMYMDTYFYYQDDKVLGKMLIITETESLKSIINNLRSNS